MFFISSWHQIEPLDISTFSGLCIKMLLQRQSAPSFCPHTPRQINGRESGWGFLKWSYLHTSKPITMTKINPNSTVQPPTHHPQEKRESTIVVAQSFCYGPWRLRETERKKSQKSACSHFTASTVWQESTHKHKPQNMLLQFLKKVTFSIQPLH